jgi:acetyl esterase
MTSHAALAQPLNDTSRALLAKIALLPGSAPEFAYDIPMRRQGMRDVNAIYGPDDAQWSALCEQITVHELAIELAGRTLRARLYEPTQALRAASPAGDTLMVYFHGGGWVVGDLDSSHHSAAFMARALGAPLLSVEYRKAPEHPYPLPVEDAIDSFDWAWRRLSTNGLQTLRIALSGDSAGGHLAAMVMHARAAQVAGALLWYPVTDVPRDTPSYLERGAGPGLTSAGMRWFWDVFMADQPLISASLLAHAWAGQPPKTVITAAWHDPLFDEAERYADALKAAGARVDFLPAYDMAHGYLRQCWSNPRAGAHVSQAIEQLKNILTIQG